MEKSYLSSFLLKNSKLSAHADHMEKKSQKQKRNKLLLWWWWPGWNPLSEGYLHPGSCHLLLVLPFWIIYLSGSSSKAPFNQIYHQSCPAYFQRCRNEWQQIFFNQHIVNVAFKLHRENRQIDVKNPQNFQHFVEYDFHERWIAFHFARNWG